MVAEIKGILNRLYTSIDIGFSLDLLSASGKFSSPTTESNHWIIFWPGILVWSGSSTERKWVVTIKFKL